MTSQMLLMLFMILTLFAGIAGFSYGLWIIKTSRVKVYRRKGITTSTTTLTGAAARRVGIVLVVGASFITLINLIFISSLF
ncbi:MAG: hypothetical protein AAGF95_17400 [Chloroflexota bacterium]